MNDSLIVIFTVICSGLFLLGCYWFLKVTMVSVFPSETVIFTRFGKSVRVVGAEGLVYRPSLIFPWEDLIRVSRQIKQKSYKDIHFNDCDGTQAKVDIWIEFKIVDPSKAIFAVEDWSTSLKNVVYQAGTSILGTKSLENIIQDREIFSATLQKEIDAITQEWGIKVQLAFIQNLHLSDELIRQFIQKVSAQIEILKAKIEEDGRIKVQQLDAETELKISELNAISKSQNMLAVGRAYAEMSKNKEVQEAYDELFRLSKLNPSRMTSFLGFSGTEMKAADALMIGQGTQSN